LVFVLRPGIIGVSELVSSNSEKISCVAFLKHKIAENRELALWHLVKYVSSGNRIKTPQSVTKHKANGVKTSMEHQKL
jgi:hypothetical protein